MTYSEFIQLKALLEENNITIKEFIENPNISEGILGKIGNGLWNLAKKGMKKAVSSGLSSKYKDKLNAAAEKIKAWVVDEIKRGQEDPKNPLYNYFKLKNNNTKDPEKQKAANKKLDKAIENYLHKNVEIQVKRMENNIEKNKTFTDEDKENLKDYWDSLKYQLEMSITMVLEEQHLLTDDGAEDFISSLAKYAGVTSGTQTKPTGKTLFDKNGNPIKNT